MTRTIVFDMDGTIANLYGVEGWLEMLRSENPLPYAIATPIYDVDTLNEILWNLKNQGWKIAITTWGAKNATAIYNNIVADVKREWLEDISFPFDYFFFQEYGTPKNIASDFIGGRQVLIDDNMEVRNSWNGETIDATQDILKELYRLLAEG